MTPNDPALLNPPLLRAAYADRTAWLMARCSELAYVKFEAGQEQQLRDSLKEIGLELLNGFNRQGTQAYLARNERFAVLAFRGTEKDWRDILSDIRIRFYHDKSGAKISTGFGQAYDFVAKEIAEAVDRLGPVLPLYITGHSLGGALAAIASTRIRPSDRIAACYTYGCPRVGNGDFANQLWKVPVYRQVHSSDIVPRVPLPFGYRHAGDMRYIKHAGTLVQDPSSLALFFSFTGSFLAGWRNVFRNHRIAGYVSALESWALYRLKLDHDLQAAPATAPATTPPKSLSASGGGMD